MDSMEPEDEFAEFDVTEDEIDAMMAEGTPTEVIIPSDLTGALSDLLTSLGARLSTDAPSTVGTPGEDVTVGTAPNIRREQPRVATLT